MVELDAKWISRMILKGKLMEHPTVAVKEENGERKERHGGREKVLEHWGEGQRNAGRCSKMSQKYSLCCSEWSSHTKQRGRERKHNNNRHRQEILQWRQSSAINDAHVFMLIWLANVNTFACMFIYIWAQTWVIHTNRHKKLSHLHYVIFLSLLNLLYSQPSQGTLRGLHKDICCHILSLCCL